MLVTLETSRVKVLLEVSSFRASAGMEILHSLRRIPNVTEKMVGLTCMMTFW